MGKAKVQDRGAGLDHVRADEMGNPGDTHQDIGLPRHLGQWLGVQIADGHGSPVAGQEQRHRLADEVAGPDNDRPLPVNLDPVALEDFQAAQRCGGHKVRADVLGSVDKRRPRQPARVQRVRAIHVLGRVQRFDDHLRSDARGQRLLEDDAMHARIAVQLAHQADHLFLVSVGRQGIGLKANARLLAGALDHASIAHRGRVVSGSHQREGGDNVVLSLELGNFCLDLEADLFRQFASVQNLGSHVPPPCAHYGPRRPCSLNLAI